MLKVRVNFHHIDMFLKFVMALHSLAPGGKGTTTGVWNWSRVLMDLGPRTGGEKMPPSARVEQYRSRLWRTPSVRLACICPMP